MRAPLFRRVLGDAFDSLPPEVRALHSVETRETWQRDFGGAPMVSRLREWNGRLVERLGLVEFVFSLGAHDGEILWATTGVRLFGVIPLPSSWFARVRCRERERNGRYEFLVEAALPLIGPLIRYEGWLARG